MVSLPRFRALAAGIALLLAAPVAAPAAPARLTVFAAASLAGSLDAVDKAFEAKTGVAVAASYGGSMTLAKQLQAGAPADVFVSADEKTMDWAVAHSAADKASRVDLLSNALVVIAPKSGALKSLAFDAAAWKAALGAGRFSTGDVKTVPVGRYAEASLIRLGLWDLVKDRIAGSIDVRAAMAFVARGEAPLGIV
ncbi:MAG: molybdate ABC transporter substrate-binding protein, partial [Hyphomicrobiales bacterium]|nr:molybdate ABC transporter substrate-binding protein [Hyphomicrobiales bacterium]